MTREGQGALFDLGILGLVGQLKHRNVPYFRAGTVTVTVIVQSHCTLERRLRRAKLDRKITLRFLTLGISYFRSLKPLTTQSTPKRPEFSSRFLTFGWILLSEDHP